MWLTVKLTFTWYYHVQRVMCSKHSTKCKYFIDMHIRMTQLGENSWLQAFIYWSKGLYTYKTRQFTIDVEKENIGQIFWNLATLSLLSTLKWRTPQTEELKCFSIHTKMSAICPQNTYCKVTKNREKKNMGSFYHLRRITIIHLFIGGIGSRWQFVKRSEIMPDIIFPNF